MRADASHPEPGQPAAAETVRRLLAGALPLQPGETAIDDSDPSSTTGQTPGFELPPGSHGGSMSLDIAPALDGWSHDADRVCVRVIRGDDALPKLQMRLDLGLLQMETAGRPDGLRPGGCVSLLSYHEARLDDHRRGEHRHDPLVLSPRDCRQLRDEADMYCRRLLGWFVLGEWELASADARHVLLTIDFLAEQATEPGDRFSLHGCKPYVVMMQARAKAALLVGDEQLSTAVRVVESALRKLGRHFRQFGGQRAHRASAEVQTLRTLIRKLRKRVPVSPIKLMKRELRRAISSENFERAAELRDLLDSLKRS